MAVVIIGGHPEEWGFIPQFLDAEDPRPAREQFNEHYIGGWMPFEGFTLHEDASISYPGDPPYRPLSLMLFRDESIVLYPHSWVLIMQEDRTWEIARMD